MVLLVLVVVWVLALTPYALRKLGEWQVSSELNRFRRGLGALGQFAPDQAGEALFTETAGEQLVGSSAGDGTSGRARQGRAPHPSSQLVMRRRRTLAWLGGSLAGTLLLGAVPWFRVLWDLSIVVLVLTICYLAALVYVQRQASLAAERAEKVVRLRSFGHPERRFTGSAAAGGARLGVEMTTPVTGTPAIPVALAAAAGGAGGSSSRGAQRPVVVALPRRPSFVLVEAPS